MDTYYILQYRQRLMVRKLESYMFIADGTLINVFSTAYTSITLPELTNSSFITCVNQSYRYFTE